LSLLALFSVLEASFARREFSKHDMRLSNKYQEHREPPVEESENPRFAIDAVEEKWIEQKLNNFDPLDRRTFMMRYLENRAHLKEGGPIFIYIGGEWTISNGTLNNGHIADMMREMNGIMFYTEHRYYGKTQPTPSVSTEDMQYLNIDQALEDLAHFIEYIKSTIPEVENSGVIVIGGSYSATMATWFVQKYPHLANGAWSSSAPLEAKVDFIEYKEVVTDAMRQFGSEKCVSRIESAYQELEKLIADRNAEKIEEIFHLCYPMNFANKLDLWAFGDSVGGMFSGLVQYHKERYQNIQRECALLDRSPMENDLEALAWYFWYDEDFEPEEPVERCFNHLYQTYIDYYNTTSWNSWAAIQSSRQWFYQTCAEYGWYQSSGSDRILFGSHFPADLYVQLCHDVYGDL
jgi:hypothetical protein